MTGATQTPAHAAELLQRQRSLQDEALQVMARLQLRERLAALGAVEHVGSSASGLMVQRDIDLCVRSAAPTRNAVLDALQPVLADPGLHEALYRDETGPRSPTGLPRDQRHYLRLRHAAAPERI